MDENFKAVINAAEQGNAEAQCILGACYAGGNGVVQDYVKAFEYWTKAANQEYADAQHLLGCCYKDGLGVAQDYAKAFNWWKKAAEQDYAW